jgi:NAD(P)-dependent dehydrogenase (short-subunit alcohol dehydrogenase family)
VETAAAEAVVSALPGSGHAVVTGDIAAPEQADGIVSTAVSALGGVGTLIDNAGIHAEHPIASSSYSDWQDMWRRIVDVNVHGTANVIWRVVDHLQNQPAGPAGAW